MKVTLASPVAVEVPPEVIEADVPPRLTLNAELAAKPEPEIVTDDPTLLLGGLGLAVDTGYDFGQRRAMQNAADAAALAGASAVSLNKSTAYDDALAAAQQNGLTDTSRFTCNYVDNTPADFLTGHDRQIEKAIEVLRADMGR